MVGSRQKRVQVGSSQAGQVTSGQVRSGHGKAIDLSALGDEQKKTTAEQTNERTRTTKLRASKQASSRARTHEVDVVLDDLPLAGRPVLDSVILGELLHEGHQVPVLVPGDGREEVVLQLVLHAAPHVPGGREGARFFGRRPS